MSWGWSDQTRKAIDFLNTGNTPSGLFVGYTDPNGRPAPDADQASSSSNPIGATSATLCSDTSQCASGFACVGGICISVSGGTDGGVSTCGSTTDNSGSTSSGSSGAPGGGGGGCGGPTGGGGNSGNTTSTSTSTPSGPCVKSGCGTKPSLGNSAGSAGGSGGGGGGNGSDCCSDVRCCRIAAGIVQCFCGPCPPPPKDCNIFCDNYAKLFGEPAPGCDPNQCTECEECQDTLFGGKECVPTSSGPCWCPGNECNGTCASCQDDGSCQESCANCMTCVTLYNVCECSPFSIRCCYSACTTGLSPTNRCQIEAGKKCEERCPPPPPGPEPCDCNCHDDCPDCYLCGADGKCYPDPSCKDKYYAVAMYFHYSGNSAGQPGGTGPCTQFFDEFRTQPAFFTGQLNAPGDLGTTIIIKPGNQGGQSNGPGACSPSWGCPTAGYTNLLAYRSDGVTSARASGINGFMFDTAWCTRRSFSTFTDSYRPGGTVKYIGWGDTAPEAAQNLYAQIPSFP